MTPIKGSEDLTRALEENNKALAKKDQEIAEKDKQIADLSANAITAGTGIVEKLQADNERMKKEAEAKDQELREKTAMLENLATQGDEKEMQLKGIIMSQVNTQDELKSKLAEQ